MFFVFFEAGKVIDYFYINQRKYLACLYHLIIFLNRYPLRAPSPARALRSLTPALPGLLSV
jgi:hypothetical protein